MSKSNKLLEQSKEATEMVKDSHVTPRDEYFTDGGQDCNPEVEESVGNEEK